MVMRALVAAIAAVASSALSTGGDRTTMTGATKGSSGSRSHPPLGPQPDRRRVLAAAWLLAGGGTGLLRAADPAGAAIDVSGVGPPTGGPPTDRSIFLGSYTDPVNHPGGTRDISFGETGFGGYNLATVRGGGGQGEPASYELPAMVFKCPGNRKRGGRWCITVDFSPKGGPKDLQGYYDEEQGGIRFVLDNNFWPKQ